MIMKKFLVILFFASLSVVANAQYFKCSPYGVVSEIDDKNYIVVTADSVSSHDLFQRVYAYVYSNFRNPDKVMNVMGEEMINIHTVQTGAYKCRGIGNMVDVDMNIILKFKNGRVRMEVVVNEQIVTSFYKYGGVRFNPNDHPEYNVTVTMFEKNGDIRSKVAVKNFNKWINAYISPLIIAIKNPKSNKMSSQEEDW